MVGCLCRTGRAREPSKISWDTLDSICALIFDDLFLLSVGGFLLSHTNDLLIEGLLPIFKAIIVTNGYTHTTGFDSAAVPIRKLFTVGRPPSWPYVSTMIDIVYDGVPPAVY